jgi:NADPH:quinone reductase-like Zn-dependent oxidoreductase
VPLLADGRVRPVVDRTFPLEDVAAAYDLVETDTTFGKVIVDVTG